jgi:hypothetical protein
MPQETTLKLSEFTDTPLFRTRDDGEKSGEQYYDEILKDAFENAIRSGSHLVLDLDGLKFLASPFLRTSVGALVEHFGLASVKSTIDFRSQRAPLRIEQAKRVLQALPS